MFGKIIGAFAGSKLAESTRSVGGPTGAVLGMGAMAIAKRMSLPALVAVTAGGYLAKKYFDKDSGTKGSSSTAPLTTEPRGQAAAPKVAPATA